MWTDVLALKRRRQRHNSVASNSAATAVTPTGSHGVSGTGTGPLLENACVANLDVIVAPNGSFCPETRAVGRESQYGVIPEKTRQAPRLRPVPGSNTTTVDHR